MKRLAVLVFLLPAVALAQDRVELNKITRVEVKPGSIEITGSRTPNFNTFTMSDPPRLVIDISEAVFAGVPEVIAGSGPVTGVKTASYGSASAAIARVLIGFDREIETDIQTSGTTLSIRWVSPGGAVAQGDLGTRPGETGGGTATVGDPGDPAAHDKAVAEAQRRAQEEREAQERAAREAAARAEEDRKAQAAAQQKAEEEARAAREREAAEAKQRAEADRRAQEEAQRKAEAEAAKRAEADRKAQEEAQRRAEEERLRKEQREAEARAKQAAEEQRRADEAAAKEAARKAEEERKRIAEQEREAKRKADEDRKAQERAEREAAAAAKKAAEEERQKQLAAEREAKARAEQERKAQQEAEARAKAEAEQERRNRAKAEREERERLEAERRKAAAEERARRDEEKRRAEEEKRRAEEEKRRAALERRNTGAPAGAQGTAAGGGRRTVSLVGFRPDGRNSRVFIRTDGAASYEIREEDDRSIVVVLSNTRIGSANNARFLDTSFFDTPVQLVNPTEVGNDVHVEIRLKSAVPYQARQDGGELVLVFSGR